MMLIDTHPFFAWMPFSIATILLVLILTVMPKKAKTPPMIAVGGVLWMFSLWLLMARYPRVLEVGWIPVTAVLAATVVGAMIWFHRAIKPYANK